MGMGFDSIKINNYKVTMMVIVMMMTTMMVVMMMMKIYDHGDL